jgi:hypothetical protein
MTNSRFGSIAFDFLKPLIKYPVTLFILLLIGYGQLFAPLYGGIADYSPVKSCKESTHYQAHILKATEKEAIFIEEEEEEDDEQFSLKKYSEECAAALLPYLPDYYSQHIERSESLHKSLFFSAFSGSRYLTFCIFRL